MIVASPSQLQGVFWVLHHSTPIQYLRIFLHFLWETKQGGEKLLMLLFSGSSLSSHRYYLNGFIESGFSQGEQ